MFKSIRMVITDVDGVLTDGRITYDVNGLETKSFHVRDGAAVHYLREAGIRTAIISGRHLDTVYVRAAELNIEDVYQGNVNKLEPYEAIKARHGLRDEEIAFLGDDLTDLAVLKRVGLSAAVADAAREVLEMARYVTSRPGGRGAFRELAEAILKAQGHWQRVVERYR